MQLSVVIPLLNEKESLQELYDWLIRVISKEGYTYELLFVDDGSTDGSWQKIEQLAQQNQFVKGICFNRNYGKSQALNAGFLAVEGEVVITMDADLQDSPDEIPELYRLITQEGYDIVSGWKKKRYDSVLAKKLPSKLFNAAARKTSGLQLHDFNCGLKIYRKAVIKTLDIYGGRHRYIPALAGQKKFKVAEIVVNHRPRMHGVTKYGGSRFFHGLFDLISILFLSRYTQSPLYFFGKIGLFTFLIGLGVDCYVIYLKYFLGEPFEGEMIANSNQDKESRIKGIYKS